MPVDKVLRDIVFGGPSIKDNVIPSLRSFSGGDPHKILVGPQTIGGSDSSGGDPHKVIAPSNDSGIHTKLTGEYLRKLPYDTSPPARKIESNLPSRVPQRKLYGESYPQRQPSNYGRVIDKAVEREIAKDVQASVREDIKAGRTPGSSFGSIPYMKKRESGIRGTMSRFSFNVPQTGSKPHYESTELYTPSPRPSSGSVSSAVDSRGVAGASAEITEDVYGAASLKQRKRELRQSGYNVIKVEKTTTARPTDNAILYIVRAWVQ